ncbi:purine and uridine phosphorylase [Aspergillus campestris IBT 28561]|uniref:Purine and uridine phosphorylase n=1 Tax=Aspergillus campestris (strain IBT 28561) TaxID=1392248 RepID=A0A2I1DAT4_ASPC2|nr:purine and uridine phosphorylase [Aspergillus campestris IBT 28561]PKY06986.1 purine and uridine phosphorylase [Aspergillus campestris IBT 28561]
MSSDKPRLTHDDYTVAWICPLVVEQTAAIVMLDSEHERLPQPPSDHNVYTLGSINGHNVVIAGLHTPGNNPAAVVATQMRNTFPQLRFGVLVGIGGGVPTKSEQGDIHLGHVVVSQPVGEHSGVIQYDHGKAQVGQFRHTGYLAPPPAVLLNAAREMDIRRAIAPEDPVLNHLLRINTGLKRLRIYKFPGVEQDRLFKADYVHRDPNASCRKCGCESDFIVDRHADDSDNYSDDEDSISDQAEQLVVHRGTIAAGELVIRHGQLRDELAKQYGILCFEMEAAGALADFPCLVIRGIADYSDSHKNDRWHGYAAAAAAAYARELFFHMPVDEVKQVKIAEHDVDQMIHQVEGLAQDNQYNKICEWLSPPDPSVNLSKALKERHIGTGSWFIQSPQFGEWISGTRQNLWLHGIPGCGKTVLSATTIEHLTQQLKPTHDVLYYFFDFNDVDKQSCDNLIRSLISQLYSRCENSRKELDKLCLSCNNGRQQPSYESLVTTFLRIVRVEEIRIVLDALDECRARPDLFLLMESLANSGCSVLATSRKEEDVESEIRRWMHQDNIIPIQNGAVDEDIRAYVHARLQYDRGFERWRSRPQVQEEIETELMRKADGMFRWATCQLDILEKCPNLPKLRESLRSLPKTLEETYGRILANIDEIYRDYAIRILQFLTYSERPLTIEEVVDALVVDPDGDIPFDPEDRMPEPRDIMRICPSLITLVVRTEEDYLEYDDPKYVTVLQLAHFSVQQYLVSTRIAATFPVNMAEVDAKATITRRRPAHELTIQFPLSTVEIEEVKKEAYAVWGDLFDPKQWWTKGLFQLPLASPLYYISLSEVDVDAQGGRGNKETVEILLDNGADAASLEGHRDIVEILLDHGADANTASFKADANAQEGVYGTALQAASFEGHRDIVKILLDKYGTALQMLLNSGADANAQGGEYGTAFQAASFKGHRDIMEMLLDSGAEINAKGGEYGTTLQAASAKGLK